MEWIKERFLNLVSALGSKKIVLAIIVVLAIIYVLTNPIKIATIGAVTVAVIIAQGYVDAQKVKKNE